MCFMQLFACQAAKWKFLSSKAMTTGLPKLSLRALLPRKRLKGLVIPLLLASGLFRDGATECRSCATPRSRLHVWSNSPRGHSLFDWLTFSPQTERKSSCSARPQFDKVLINVLFLIFPALCRSQMVSSVGYLERWGLGGTGEWRVYVDRGEEGQHESVLAEVWYPAAVQARPQVSGQPRWLAQCD